MSIVALLQVFGLVVVLAIVVAFAARRSVRGQRTRRHDVRARTGADAPTEDADSGR